MMTPIVISFSVHVLLLVLEARHADADVYLHMPRGSNNRLNEATRNRNNAKRLFDSQNNNRGGYNVGTSYYYQGSTVNFQWTNQHSCSDKNTDCQVIIQYMCHDLLRDGSTTIPIPLNPSQCASYDCTKDLRYGMHEDLVHHLNCRSTERGNVYAADKLYNARTATQSGRYYTADYTRQNPRATRYAYECPEERDYYPYWNPSPWKDIAVLTNDVSRCEYYRAESQNVKKRGYCNLPFPLYYFLRQCRERAGGLFTRYLWRQPTPRFFPAPTDKATCESITYNHTYFRQWLATVKGYTRCHGINIPNDPTKVNNTITLSARWIELLSHNAPPPVCREAPWSRDNHLGNGVGGHPNSFNWTVPSDVQSEFCAFRIRYNISSNEFDRWGVSRANDSTNMKLNFGFSSPEAAATRGFVFKQNPVVDVFGSANIPLRLAVNTAQFGRTFQDRSHSFAIRTRPAGVPANARIHNIQVQGKRGNIVQVYPGVEYDFVPNRLTASQDDYIHFQWTGSNSNPANNAGQGQRGSDRHNAILLSKSLYEEGSSNVSGYVYGKFGSSYPELLTDQAIAGFTRDQAEALAVLQHGGNKRGSIDPELDDMSPYYDHGLAKANTLGVYHYMCTRNNNFSNRSQKGRLAVVLQATATDVIGRFGGTLALQSAVLSVSANAVSTALVFTISTYTDVQCQKFLEGMGSAIYGTGLTVTDCVVIEPEGNFLATGDEVSVTLNLTASLGSSPLSSVKVFGTLVSDGARAWTQTSDNTVDTSTRTVTFNIAHGGLYVTKQSSSAPLASLIMTLVVVAFLMVAVAVYMSRGDRFNKVRRGLSYAILSFRSEV